MEQFQEFLTEEGEDVNANSIESSFATKSKGSREDVARIKATKAMTAEIEWPNPKARRVHLCQRRAKPRSLVSFIRCLMDV